MMRPVPALVLVVPLWLCGCLDLAEPARAPPPVSYAIPVGMRVAEGVTEWPAIAASADGDLAVVTPDGTLTVFAPWGEARFSAEGLIRSVAIADRVVLVAAEDALRLYTLEGERLDDVAISGSNTAVATHPDGGFVVAVEDGGDTRVVFVAAAGAVRELATLSGWTSDDPRPPLLAVRADGVVGLLLHGAGETQPAELLGVELARDDAADAGIRSLLIAIRPDGSLLEAISFYTWGRLVELRADRLIQVLSQESPIGSKMRSVLTDTILGRIRLEAVRASTVLLLGDEPEVVIIEGETPAMASGDVVFILRPSTEGPWQDLVDESNGIQVPVAETGECRSFFVSATRLLALCASPPFQSLAPHGDTSDSDVVGWGLSVLRNELGI